MAFSPDGTRVATAALDNTMKLLDATSGDALMVMQDHATRVNFVAFSSDGARLVLCGDGGVVNILETQAPSVLGARSDLPLE